MRNPENRERPNSSELRPKPQPTEEQIRKLGKAAVDAAQKK
ncbi:hypothetical protein [Propioniciclava sp. MC1683]|jgi:hypothetical protein|nr:hypothetical protein [Propioniciclava sp. MC1683]